MKKYIYLFLVIIVFSCSDDDNATIDTIAPVITLLGEPNVVVIQNEEYIDAGATATDNVDGDITDNIVAAGYVNINVPDSYTLTYTVSDAAGNTATISRVVNVIEALDTIAPVITLIGEANVSVLQYTNYVDEGATATDNVDGDITWNIVVTGGVNLFLTGIYTLTYTVSDAAGNIATTTRQVTVVENEEANPVYLDENGITIKAIEWAEVGAMGVINNVIYTVVDGAMLRTMVENEEDLTQLATTKVTDMSNFFFIGGPPSDFNQNIGNWDVSNVTDMNMMFYNCITFNQDIGIWDVSNVTNMQSLFFYCSNFNQDIGGWNVSSVTNMQSMFDNSTIFNQDIGDWDVSNVSSMSKMFANVVSFNQDISNWNVSSVNNMMSMFVATNSFNQPIGNWDVSNVTNMQSMFSSSTVFNQPIENWDVSNATNLSLMFSWAEVFNQDLSSWNVSNVIDCQNFDYQTPQWVLPTPIFTNCTP